MRVSPFDRDEALRRIRRPMVAQSGRGDDRGVRRRRRVRQSGHAGRRRCARQSARLHRLWRQCKPQNESAQRARRLDRDPCKLRRTFGKLRVVRGTAHVPRGAEKDCKRRNSQRSFFDRCVADQRHGGRRRHLRTRPWTAAIHTQRKAAPSGLRARCEDYGGAVSGSGQPGSLAVRRTVKNGSEGEKR